MNLLVMTVSPSVLVFTSASSISFCPMLVEWTYVSCVKSIRLSIIRRKSHLT